MADEAAIRLFWKQTLERAKAGDLQSSCSPVAEPVPYRRFRVILQSLGGTGIVSHLAVPIGGGGHPTRWPAVVTFPGYGGWEFGQLLSECQRGCILMQVYPRMQGESGDAADGTEHLLRGIGQPEGYYYRGVFADGVRAIDYLVSRPDVDASRIGLMATSQGGGIALAVAALEPRVRATVAHVPFFCDLRNNSRFLSHPVSRPEFLETFDYFDPVNLASWIQTPVLLSSGGRDQTCPPATIQAVFSKLRGIKTLFHDPDLTHTSSAAFYEMGWEWMNRYLF